MEVKAGVQPLTLRREAQTLKYWVRISSRPCNPNNQIFGKGYFVKRKFKNPVLPFGASTLNLVEEHLPEDVSVADSRSSFDSPWLLKPQLVDISLSLKLTKSDPPSQILDITEDHMSTYKFILMVAKMKI